MRPAASYLWGPRTRFGIWVIALTCALDQALKLWLLFVYDLAHFSPTHLGPFFDLVLTWNTGISYGLFQTNSALGAAVLLGVKVVAVILLWVWMARAESRWVALALGLIIGGAIGNAIDRLAYGAVADFILFTPKIAGVGFPYVFNLADSAIVAGVAVLLYESLLGSRSRSS